MHKLDQPSFSHHLDFARNISRAILQAHKKNRIFQ
jgi:hypothetical protein